MHVKATRHANLPGMSSKAPLMITLDSLGMVLLSSSEQDARAELNLLQQSHSGLVKDSIPFV